MLFRLTVVLSKQTQYDEISDFARLALLRGIEIAWFILIKSVRL